jgi:hypothetical protein
MNRQWMRERLESFKALCENYQDEGRRTADYTDTMRSISDQMAYQMPTVRAILGRLDPTLAQEVTEPQDLSGASDSLRAVQQGLGILGERGRVSSQPHPGRTLAHRRPVPPARLAGRVGPAGHRPVPSCRGTGDGLAVGAHRREGGLVAHRARVGRPGVLAQSARPEPGAPAAAGRQVDQDVAVTPGGAPPAGAGAFAGIRKVATHTESEWSEQIALEHARVHE